MNSYILSIDAGTTGITILVIDKNFSICQKYYKEFTQYFPKEGWVEHDPIEIWNVTYSLIIECFKDYPKEKFISIGITNQRETTIIWDKKTSKPIYNAIVWQCRRTKDICDKLQNDGYSPLIKEKTGLVIDSYFSGTKIKWIIENIPSAFRNNKYNRLAFGTVDSWLIWNLTNGNEHVTDYTNASRTMIFNINNKKWDRELLSILNIPYNILPDVKPSVSEFGRTHKKIFNYDIPITAIAGDQQAALYGQKCFNTGDTKCTYGTGCFLMTNTGKNRLDSTSGLITTIACDSMGNPAYALEGSVFMGGAIIQWLRDELKIISSASESEGIALSIEDTKGVIIIPAFTGLGAPYWNMEARGIISGLTRGVNRKHIIRAALESIAFQVSDLIDSINEDVNTKISHLKVDGGASANNFLMQFQSSISDLEIHRPSNIESTALGIGLLSGISSKLWDDPSKVKKSNEKNNVFKPTLSKNIKDQLLVRWKKAIEKSLL